MVIGSLVLAAVLWAAGYPPRRIVGAVPWFLLCAVMVIGPKAWKWHQSHGTDVSFWLLTVHIYDMKFARCGLRTEDVL